MMSGKTGSTQVRRITMKERQTRVLKQNELPWNTGITVCLLPMRRMTIPVTR